MLHEILEKLRLPLIGEAKSGFANVGFIGGLDAHILSQTRRALDFMQLGEVPRAHEFSLQRLHDMWMRYAEADTQSRAKIVEDSQKILAVISAEAPTQPPPEGEELCPTSSDVSEIPLSNPSPSRGGWVGANVGTNVGAIETKAQTIKPKTQIAFRPDLSTELTYLKGIGPKRAELLQKLGLKTVYDLLYYFPARYEDRRVVKPLESVEIGAKEAVMVTVLYPPSTRVMGGRMSGRKVTKVRVGDDSGRADLQWWNQPYREKQFQPGMQLFVYGKIGEFNGLIQMDSPEFEILGENDQLQVGRIVPVYPMTEGLHQGPIRRAIYGALEMCGGNLEEMLPHWILQQNGFPSLENALRQIHFPDSWEAQKAARERLVFEELFLLQVALAQKKIAAHTEEIGLRHEVDDEKIKAFVRALPFKLTGAQKRVMNEIRKDLKSPRPMNRLLHGDVGSGKTIVAAYALWTAHMTGHQGALLAPTEILAEQHFSTLTRLFKPMGIEVALLEGSIKSKNKRRIQADLSEGRVSIIVGTHALIQEGIEFNKLGICVIDEQHRFGVMQRAALQHKGIEGLRPDVLVMTATPIPRTMALTIYGDLDVSVLDELPPGRQPIKTVKIKPNQRDRAYKFVLDEIKGGRQAYVVCPLVEESEKLAHLQAATALAERLRHEELKDLRVGLVHGQMNVIERDEQMELFRAGMHDVLVSTTVIEVGVDVPNSTVMLIEDAERFGLSQLHQLRGRVGRGVHKSYCVLLGDPRTDEGKARLGVMTKTQNGFEIAEHDLQLRGPGEFYGTRQSGLPDFRLANIISDVEIIQQAREAAFALVQANPHLQGEEHDALKRALRRFWGEKLSLIQVS
ncbi:MAG TPA: ATP-dependent DNA helicase RecG [Abditibacteriaceae bacterium]